MSDTQLTKCQAFRALHAAPSTFVMPNPWDIGSALYLQHMGFPALATTSAGAAFALGRPDGGMTVAEVLAHIGSLAETTTVPMNADFEAGFATETAAMAENVRLCVGTGVAGLSIEDATGDASAPLYNFDRALERVRAARRAIDATGVPVVFTARCEAVLFGLPNGFDEAVKRLVAFADAGADCLYAPGVRRAEEIAALVKAVAPKPVNVLMGSPGLTVRQLEDLGVRRISLGSALARAAWGAAIAAAEEILKDGTFQRLGAGTPHRSLNAFFAGVARGGGETA